MNSIHENSFFIENKNVKGFLLCIQTIEFVKITSPRFSLLIGQYSTTSLDKL